MNTNYRSSEVGGNPENQFATLKSGICYGQPVGEKKKESTPSKKGRGRLRHKKVKKNGEEGALRQTVLQTVLHHH